MSAEGAEATGGEGYVMSVDRETGALTYRAPEPGDAFCPHCNMGITEFVAARVQQAEAERDDWKASYEHVLRNAHLQMDKFERQYGLRVAAEAERDALRERVEALADEWDLLGDYVDDPNSTTEQRARSRAGVLAAEQLRAALDG